MTRALIIVLLAANLGYFAWTQGWLVALVPASPLGDREPHRLAQQVEPESVTVLSPAAAAAITARAATDPSLACLEAGPFDDAQIEAAEAALTALVPAGHWSRTKTTLPGTWLVYMGKFLDDETLQRKQAELKRLKIEFEAVKGPAALVPGLALGRYDSPEAAEQGLEALAPRGVRTARVVEIAPARSTYVLRVEGAEPSLARQGRDLRHDALGKGFAPCRKAGGRNNG